MRDFCQQFGDIQHAHSRKATPAAGESQQPEHAIRLPDHA
jgi:hypothetical protein